MDVYEVEASRSSCTDDAAVPDCLPDQFGIALRQSSHQILKNLNASDRPDRETPTPNATQWPNFDPVSALSDLARRHHGSIVLARVMPVSYTIDPSRRVIWVAFFGDVTARDFHRYFALLETDPQYDPSFARVIDWRDIRVLPSASDIEDLTHLILVSAARGARPGRRALLVHPGAQFGVGRMLQINLDLRGCRAELDLFTDTRDAEAWAAVPSAAASVA